MKRETYYQGVPGVKWGIWNVQRKCWQFGISEDTPMLAEARLFQKIGDDARKWRFEPRQLPAAPAPRSSAPVAGNPATGQAQGGKGGAIRGTPCDLCRFEPPSSFDGKPCSLCPAAPKEGAGPDDR